MKLKQILVLILILLLLIAGVVARQFQKPAADLATQEYVSLGLSFDTSKVEKIQLGKGAVSSDPQRGLLVNIVKDASGKYWRIPDFSNATADQDKINEFLKQINEAKGELRGSDKALFADFKIGEDEAFRVELLDKDWKSLLTFFIGAKKAGYDLFVRKDGSDAIYLTNANLLGAMGVYGDPEKEKSPMDYWASLRYAEGLEIEKVNTLEATRFKDGGAVVAANVVRQVNPEDSSKKIWKYGRSEVPFAVDADKIQRFLSSLTQGQASKVLDPKAKDYGLASPSWKMKLGLEGGGEVTFTVSKQDPETKNYFLQTSAASAVFQLSEYYLRNMDIDDSKFFVDNSLDVNPDKVENLVIHTAEKELKFTPKQQKSDALTSYMTDLKTFSVARLLFDGLEQKKATPRQWLEIQEEGKTPRILEVGEVLSENKEYAARLRNNTAQPFAISEATVKKLFDNLDRLTPT